MISLYCSYSTIFDDSVDKPRTVAASATGTVLSPVVKLPLRWIIWTVSLLTGKKLHFNTGNIEWLVVRHRRTYKSVSWNCSIFFPWKSGDKIRKFKWIVPRQKTLEPNLIRSFMCASKGLVYQDYPCFIRSTRQQKIALLIVSTRRYVPLAEATLNTLIEVG